MGSSPRRIVAAASMTGPGAEVLARWVRAGAPGEGQRDGRRDRLAGQAVRYVLAQCRELLAMAQAKATLRSGAKDDYRGLYETLTGKSLTLCPVCAIGHMLISEILPKLKGRQCAWDSS